MGTATIQTKLPLATWAKIIGIHPLHFEGIEFTPSTKSPQVCEAGWQQFDWQSADRVSRESVATAIAEAERVLEDELGVFLMPTWEEDEWLDVARPYRAENVGYNSKDIRGYQSPVRAKHGYYLSGGVETRTLIMAGRPIAWSDVDGDGFTELGTVTATVDTSQLPCEVEIYYPDTDGDPARQIRPATVVISGATATITFRRELCVKIEDVESFDGAAADYTDDGDFLSEVDVYRHWNDPSLQAVLLWSPTGCIACGGVSGGGTGCTTCGYTAQTACTMLRSDPRLSLVSWTPATWDADTGTFSTVDYAPQTPDLVRMYYRSGFMAKHGCPTVMSPEWARTVAYLSVSMLERPLCDCTINQYDYWRQDMAARGGDEQYFLQSSFKRNPLGTSRGALYAWQRVKRWAVPRVAVAD